MKCPRCGVNMKEGHLYCEECGNEIQMVPEFEPEIENSIFETLSDVAIEIGADPLIHEWNEEQNDHKADTKELIYSEKKKVTKIKWKTIIAAGVIFIIALAFIYGFWSNQPKELYQKAVRQMENGSYEAALASFENAVSRSDENVIYKNGMADCCILLGDETRAEQISREILLSDPANQEAYLRLIKILKNRQDFVKINELLQACESREIVNQYLDYMANPPAFDMESGTYREKITVKLIANAAGTLYYTLDGSVPTAESEIYTTPFTLESGSFTIRALFVNQYGVASELSKAVYFIDVSRPDAPAVSPESGEYNLPGYINVEIPQNCKIYYTTDGTVPDASSSMYDKPIPMPAGNSSFSFVVCDEGGICGKITERKYNLKLNAALSMEAASNQLMLVLKNAGVLQNLQGDVAGRQGRNIYTYKYALTIEGKHYYLYREYYEETSGNSNVTGNDYVVNYMTGECFKAIRDQDASYELNVIENAENSGNIQESRS